MIIVIDAYNLLHAMPSYKKTLTDQERNRFIKQLGMYGRRKDHKMVVVFDGGRFEWPNKEKVHSVYVVYSGIHESADDYIKEYLHLHRAQEMLLVSSDREINRVADHIGIASINSFDFYQLLKEALQKKESVSAGSEDIVKMTDETNYAIDELMMNAAKNMPTKAEDFVCGTARVGEKKLSKHDRVLLKKLHKL
jgi:predicted RNA-binding protein with PIN domain